MDDDFDFDGPSKAQPKKGRRARAAAEAEKADVREDVGATEKSMDGTEVDPLIPVPPRPSRRQKTGWGMSSAPSKDDNFDSRLLQTNDPSDDEEIPVIPDLDEIHNDDMEQEVAAPPSLLSSNIASYRELDIDLMNRSAFRTLDGNIDLKVLVKNLSSEQEVRQETDVEWEWEKLFAEVSANLKSKQEGAAIIQNPSQERII